MASSPPTSLAEASTTRPDCGAHASGRHPHFGNSVLHRSDSDLTSSNVSLVGTLSQLHYPPHHRAHTPTPPSPPPPQLSSTHLQQWWAKMPPKLDGTTRGGVGAVVGSNTPGQELLPATTLRSASGSVVTFMDCPSLASGSNGGSWRRSGSLGSGLNSSASRPSCGSGGVPHLRPLARHNSGSARAMAMQRSPDPHSEPRRRHHRRRSSSSGKREATLAERAPHTHRVESAAELDVSLRLTLPPVATHKTHAAVLRWWAPHAYSSVGGGGDGLQRVALTSTNTSHDLRFDSLTQVENVLEEMEQEDGGSSADYSLVGAVPISDSLQQVRHAMGHMGFSERKDGSGAYSGRSSLPAIVREESLSMQAVHEDHDHTCKHFLNLVHRSPVSNSARVDGRLLLPSVSVSLHSSRFPGKSSNASSFSSRCGTGGSSTSPAPSPQRRCFPSRSSIHSRGGPDDPGDELSELSAR